MSAAARYIGSGLTLLVLGLLIGIGWYFSHHTVTRKISADQVRDALVLESTHSKGYYNWEEGNALNNPNHYVFYLWNITNLAEVLNGSIPVYEQVGPYTYQYIWYNKNASFLDSGNIVEYNFIEDYIYVPDMSASDPTQDLVTTFNPAYLTILAQTGGDSQMIQAAGIPVIGLFLDFLTGEYIDVISSQTTPSVLASTLSSVYTFLANQLQVDNDQAAQFFFSYWANGTALPPYFINWPGLFPTIDETSVISATTVELLFSNQSFSLLDERPVSIITWMRASNNISGAEGQQLMANFSLSPSQLQAVVSWRNASFIPVYVYPELVSQARENYPVAQLEDVGWVQFVLANFTSPSFSDVYKKWYPQYPSPFELGQTLPDVFTVAQTKMLLVGPMGVLNIQNFALFQVAQAGGDLSPWGVTDAQAGAFILGYVAGLSDYASAVVTPLVTSGQTGLIMTQTADYWLWRCMDPLVAFLAGPESAMCGLQTNNTVQLPSQILTGKNNITQLGTYVSWRNQTTVNVWNEPVNVFGCTDSGQFGPFIEDNQTLYVWDESFVKTLEFDNVGKTQVQGIDVYKYVMNSNAYDVSQLYFNGIQGFANETSTNEGAPIFLSNFDFYGVIDPKYSNFSSITSNSSDVTTIYVEPITGSTLQADEKLQVNLYYPPAATGWNTVFKQFANVRTDVIYPLMKAWQQSSVSESQAKKLKAQLVVFKPRFNSALLWGMVGFGALLAVVGILLVVLGVRRKKRDGYQPINL